MPSVLLCQGTALALPLRDASVHTCVTSPPYYGLRSYGIGEGELGLESTLEAYVEAMVQVFREVWRVLHPMGTLFLNMGDSYASSGMSGLNVSVPSATFHGGKADARQRERHLPPGIPAKNLLGMPWRLAFALQADGWILRSAITWCKTAPMPESVGDRPTRATEMIFLLAKSPRYFYDATAVRVSGGTGWHGSSFTSAHDVATKPGLGQQIRSETPGHNLWDYWLLGPEPTGFQHYACMPTALVRRCLLAGAPPGGVVFDPFCGSGTTLLVARELGHHAIGLDLSWTYLSTIARERLGLTALHAWEHGQQAPWVRYDDLPLFGG